MGRAQVYRVPEALHAKGLDDHEIAAKLNCARTTVFRFRNGKLHLPANGPFNERTEKRRIASIRRTFQREWGVDGVHQIRDIIRAAHAAKVGWMGFSPGQALILNALEEGQMTALEICRLVETTAARNGFRRYRKFGLAGLYPHLGRLRRAGWIVKHASQPGFGRSQSRLYNLSEQAHEHMRRHRSRDRPRATA